LLRIINRHILLFTAIDFILVDDYPLSNGVDKISSVISFVAMDLLKIDKIEGNQALY